MSDAYGFSVGDRVEIDSEDRHGRGITHIAGIMHPDGVSDVIIQQLRQRLLTGEVPPPGPAIVEDDNGDTGQKQPHPNIKGVWVDEVYAYFIDEAEQFHGPYKNAGEAQDAMSDYLRWLNHEKCDLCGGEGVVNLFNQRVTESSATENWPGPCPRCRTKAIEDVIAERVRQTQSEKWTPEHDDAHTRGEMALAAACYAQHAAQTPDARRVVQSYHMWPENWSPAWWKPKTPRQDLVRAAALLIAEIERLDRAKP